MVVVMMMMILMMMMIMKWRPGGVVGKVDPVVLAMSPARLVMYVPCVQHEDIEVVPCNGQARQSKNQTTDKGSWEHLESSNKLSF